MASSSNTVSAASSVNPSSSLPISIVLHNAPKSAGVQPKKEDIPVRISVKEMDAVPHPFTHALAPDSMYKNVPLNMNSIRPTSVLLSLIASKQERGRYALLAETNPRKIYQRNLLHLYDSGPIVDVFVDDTTLTEQSPVWVLQEDKVVLEDGNTPRVFPAPQSAGVALGKWVAVYGMQTSKTKSRASVLLQSNNGTLCVLDNEKEWKIASPDICWNMKMVHVLGKQHSFWGWGFVNEITCLCGLGKHRETGDYYLAVLTPSSEWMFHPIQFSEAPDSEITWLCCVDDKLLCGTADADSVFLSNGSLLGPSPPVFCLEETFSDAWEDILKEKGVIISSVHDLPFKDKQDSLLLVTSDNHFWSSALYLKDSNLYVSPPQLLLGLRNTHIQQLVVDMDAMDPMDADPRNTDSAFCAVENKKTDKHSSTCLTVVYEDEIDPAMKKDEKQARKDDGELPRVSAHQIRLVLEHKQF